MGYLYGYASTHEEEEELRAAFKNKYYMTAIIIAGIILGAIPVINAFIFVFLIGALIYVLSDF